MTSIITVNYNGGEHTRNLLRSLAQHERENEIIVVDNCSTDGSQAIVRREFPDVPMIGLDTNRGFGAANNVGSQAAHGEFLFFLNNDTIVHESVVVALEVFLRRNNNVGVCGPTLLNADGSVQWSSGTFPTVLGEMRNRREQCGPQRDAARNPVAVDWITGAALMIRKSLFDTIGGFDEEFFMYFEDVDLCRRVRESGREVFIEPAASVTHLGASLLSANKPGRIQVAYRASQLRYYEKHNSVMQQQLLKLYLMGKYARQGMFGSAEEKSVAREVMRRVIM